MKSHRLLSIERTSIFLLQQSPNHYLEMLVHPFPFPCISSQSCLYYPQSSPSPLSADGTIRLTPISSCAVGCSSKNGEKCLSAPVEGTSTLPRYWHGNVHHVHRVNGMFNTGHIICTSEQKKTLYFLSHRPTKV